MNKNALGNISFKIIAKNFSWILILLKFGHNILVFPAQIILLALILIHLIPQMHLFINVFLVIYQTMLLTMTFTCYQKKTSFPTVMVPSILEVTHMPFITASSLSIIHRIISFSVRL